MIKIGDKNSDSDKKDSDSDSHCISWQVPKGSVQGEIMVNDDDWWWSSSKWDHNDNDHDHDGHTWPSKLTKLS